MAFIIVSAIVFIIVAIGIVQISMLIGGSRELANATDAAGLNTGRLATTVKVDINSGGDESQYSDVAEDSKSFSLKSIDRMWGKCLIVQANQDEMKNDGYDSGDSSSHASSMFDAATAISNRLADKLKDPHTLYPFFDQMSKQESMRMLGKTAGASSDQIASAWKTSLYDREVESNVAVVQGQLPPPFNMAEGKNVIKASDGKLYFQGYVPIQANGNSICFVPFKLNAQPHLMSKKDFDSNTATAKPISEWPDAVPNSFSCQGKSNNQKEGVQKAISWVLTNPQKTFPLSLPHSFIHIKLDTNTAHFNCNGVPYPIYDTDYDYFPPSPFVASAESMDAGLGSVSAMIVPLGTEFLPPTLWQCLAALGNYGGSYDSLKTVLTQRCAEMKGGFSESDLESTLGTMVIPGVTDYYIYPDDNGDVAVAPSTSHLFPPSWVLSGGSADGSKKSDLENNTVLNPTAVVIVIPNGIGGGGGLCTEEDHIDWTAGTGYNGCLGEVKVSHSLTAYIIAGTFF